MRLNFKKRKVLHYTLLVSIAFFQILLGLIIYNEVFNESKLKELETDLYIAEQAGYFSDLTQKDYIEAQDNLQRYIRTKDEQYLIKYNEALNNLNTHVQKLVKTAGKSDLFTLHLNDKNRFGLSTNNIRSIIDSLRTVEILPVKTIKEDLSKLNRIHYDDILDSIHVETNLSIDSIERKNLLSRLGNAISGKVDIQKEKLNTTLTLKHGKNLVTGDIDEQLTYILNKTNDYYQKEFSKYKNQISKLKQGDSDFIEKNTELLAYSNLLLKKYNEALVSFTRDARHQFQKQYNTNKLIRNYTVIGLVFIMIVISIALILLTRMAFEYEKRLLKAQAKIQQNLRFKNRIVSMISHEIRSPLNTIAIYSKGIRRQVQDQEVQDSLKSIEFTTNSLLLLANQILDFSKNEHKKLALNNTTFNLKTELDGILQALTSFVKSNENKLYIKNTVTESTIVNSDVVKIYQLFYNIVGNANKFTHKGTIHISIQTEEVENNQLKLLVAIKDNGTGIDEEDLKHVFESYHQGKNIDQIKNIGVGLGLNLCKEIVELFKGKIAITSKKNVETVVKFDLFINKAQL